MSFRISSIQILFSLSASKFVTDRQYHGDLPTDADALEEWSGGEGEEGVGISIEDSEGIVRKNLFESKNPLPGSAGCSPTRTSQQPKQWHWMVR